VERHTIVAVYETASEAERVRERLLAAGVSAESIRYGTSDHPTEMAQASAKHSGGFFDWLFGAEPSDNERQWYQTNLSGGRTALSVQIDDESRAEAVHRILEESDAVAIDDDEVTTGGDVATGARTSGDDEQVIPLEKEQLQVGKRQTETKRRIRVYAVERPVEESVTLTDETIVVERRPVTGIETHSGAFQERDIEITERHEEPVVAKTTTADEAVVVRKTARQREETVRDQLRETKVDVDPGSGDNTARPSKAP
jgi:hypothetical protein